MDSNKMMEELSKKGYTVELDSGIVYVISEDSSFGFTDLKKLLSEMGYKGSIGLRLKKEAAISYYRQNKINPDKPYAREMSGESSLKDTAKEERETSAFMTVQKVASKQTDVDYMEEDHIKMTEESPMEEPGEIEETESGYEEDSMEHEATYYDMNFEFEDNGQMRLF